MLLIQKTSSEYEVKVSQVLYF